MNLMIKDALPQFQSNPVISSQIQSNPVKYSQTQNEKWNAETLWPVSSTPNVIIQVIIISW